MNFIKTVTKRQIDFLPEETSRLQAIKDSLFSITDLIPEDQRVSVVTNLLEDIKAELQFKSN